MLLVREFSLSTATTAPNGANWWCSVLLGEFGTRFLCQTEMARPQPSKMGGGGGTFKSAPAPELPGGILYSVS
jgi:hypothetical protein